MYTGEEIVEVFTGLGLIFFAPILATGGVNAKASQVSDQYSTRFVPSFAVDSVSA